MELAGYLQTINDSIAAAKSGSFGSLHFPYYHPATSAEVVRQGEQAKQHIANNLKGNGYYVSCWMELSYVKVETEGQFQEIFIAWEDSEVESAKAKGYIFI